MYLNNGSAISPVLAAKGRLQANSSILDVGENSCLVVSDWNNDGKKDLIIGNQDIQIRVFLNTGTNSSPTFGNYSVVSNVSYYRGSPEIADLNGDGKKNLIVGDNDGYVYYHQNIGRDAAPSFASGGGVRLKTQAGSNIKVDYGAHIDLADWDANGSLDLLVGDFYGYVELYLNTAAGSNVEIPAIENPVYFSLEQNYPNPFNSRTMITYKISKPGNFNLSVFNETGRLVKTAVNGYLLAGEYSIEWSASEVSSGIYFYQITSGKFSEVKKCLLLK